MKFKGTAALFLTLLILGSWVYWTDIRDREEREQAEEEAGLVFPVDNQFIVAISINYQGSMVSAVRTDGRWEFVSPEGFEADSGEWDTVASNIGRIDRDQSVTFEPAALTQFGLVEPELRLGVRLADGSSEEILFGNENPRGGFHYLKLASSDEVFLAAASWLGLFRKEANDLRDKTLLRFDRDQVEAIEIIGERDLSLQRDSAGWNISKPIMTRADDGQVGTLIGAIDFARATDFAGSELSVSDAGLEPPHWRIMLQTVDIPMVHELLIGEPVSDDTEKYYAKDVSRASVFIIEGEIVDLLSKSLFEWRDKTVVSFDRTVVAAIEISKTATDELDGDQIQLIRTDNDWFTESNEVVDFGRVSALISALEFEQASEIFDVPGPIGTYGLDNPVLRVVFRDAAGRAILDGSFGVDADDDDHAYWKSSEEMAVVVVSKDILSQLDVNVESLLSDPPASTP